MTKERVWLIGKIVVSASLIIYFFKKIDIAQVNHCFVTCHISWLLWAIILSFLANAVSTYKWQILLNTVDVKIGFKKLFSLNLVSLFYNLFLPAGPLSGEIIKGIKLTNLCKRGREVLISIAMDRLTGMLALIILALGGIYIQYRLTKDYKLLIWILSILVIITLFILFILNKQFASLSEKIGLFIFERKGLRFFKNYISSLWNLLKIYRKNTPVIWKVISYSFIFHLLAIIIYYFVALSIAIQIPFSTFIWITSIVFIIQTLPISISGIGVREGTFIFLLAQYQVPAFQSLALSLIIFGIMILQGLVGGVIEIKNWWVDYRRGR